jgi:hypothetical protein
MNRTTILTLTAGWLTFGSLAAAAGAQQVGDAVTGVTVEHYTLLAPEVLGIRSITVTAVPFAARVQAMPNLWIDVAGAYANGSLRLSDGSTLTLTGPTDTELRATLSLLDDRLALGVGYLAPTGPSSYTAEEAAVAGVAAADLLPLRVSNWGTGGGLSLSTSLAIPAGAFRLSATAGYTIASEFEPLADDAFVFRPGNETLLQLRADRPLTRTSTATLRLGMRQYADDAIGGENIYQAGTRLDALASLSFAVGLDATGLAYAGVLRRNAGTESERFGDIATQDVMLIGSAFRIVSPGWTLLPSTDLRIVRRSDGYGQGYLSAVGVGAEFPFGAVTVTPAVRGRFGRLYPWDGETVSVRGEELSLTIRLGGGSR